ncbi:MAG: sensor histidine kinase, partial [Promethearchaeota archaeon]
SVANAERVKKLRDDSLAYKNELKNVIDDLTKQLIHAQRLSSIGTMSMEVLHEIKNQMTLISIGGQTIEKIKPEFENFLSGRIEDADGNKERFQLVLNELSNSISNVKSGINRTMRITNSFGNYTFRGGEENIGCDINECIMQALELCRGRLKKNVLVLTKLGEELPAVRAEPQPIQQVWVNLLLNSADAIESNGKGKVEIETFRRKENVCVELRDDGPGIPVEKFDRMWDAFYTTKHNGKGNGLGLSVSKRIIEGLGGSITAKNSSGGGAIFTIEIPVKEDM